MRTKAELLQLLLDNIELIENKGLCLVIYRLWCESKKISLEEKVELNIVIGNHPTKLYKETYSSYYFPAGEKEPRIKYLKQLIKHYENEQTIGAISFR